MHQYYNFLTLAPPAPTYMDVTDVGTTTVGVAWGGPVTVGYSEVQSYELIFDTVIGIEQKGCEDHQYGSAVTNNTEYIISGLAEYTTYNVSIMAVNRWGTSEPRSQLISTLSSGK